MSKTKDSLKISEVKGRPMLHWVGKQPLDTVSAFPAQLVETYAAENPPQTPTWENLKDNWHNLLFHGDNKEVLSTLLVNGFRGKIDLVYIDPPFDSGADYVRKVSLRGKKNKLTAEEYTITEQMQYVDIWKNDTFLQFIYERIVLIKELLKDTGVVFVHVDSSRVHYFRFILDEVFSNNNFRNEIIWRNTNSHNSATMQFGPIHQNILFYSKSDIFHLEPLKRPFTAGYIDSRFIYEDSNGKYQPNYLTGPGTRKGASGKTWKGFNPTSNGRHWAIPKSLKLFLPDNGKGLSVIELLNELEKKQLIIFPKKIGGQPMYKQYISDGVFYQDLWAYQPNTSGTLFESDECIDEDVKWLEQEEELEDYPTQKPEGLLKRIIQSCTNEDNIILDCFIGSGTTAAVAQKLGRRWIGCDINKGAIQTTSKRLQTIVKEQQAELKKEKQKLPLEKLPNYYLPFCYYRINDYDVQVQHNELKNLIYEHLGIRKLPSDSFFDGTLGTELVKIVPLNHPLTLLDVQIVKDELTKRRDEERNIVMVSLGKELAVDEELGNYNKLKPINKIRVIELRTDKKYGAFFTHKPAQADVRIERKDKQAHIKIRDFISPTIIQRLNIDAKLFTAQIKDFRSQIDCILIDNDFDGKVFNIFLSDAPEKKNDLVIGEYNIKIPSRDSKIAVKIIDMLGEEVLIVN